MRRRLAARLLVLDPLGRVLLLRFVHRQGDLAGQDYWATPGGGVEPGETVQQAAIRELTEETGFGVTNPGAEIGRRSFVMTLLDGERVEADERYFLVRVSGPEPAQGDPTAEERTVVVDHRWWSLEQLEETDATIWPERLADMLRTVTT